MLKAIALDDEPIALDVLRNLSGKAAVVDIAAYFTNAFEALGYLQTQKVDLIFLDVKMPDLSGIDFLKSIPNPPMVIITTAYSEHAVESFDLDAVDFLLKPFSLARFLKACNKASEQLTLKKNTGHVAAAPPSVFIKSGYENVRIELSAVLYVESYGNYVQFVLDHKKITSRLTMSEAETLLSAHGFVRIHRSYLIAKKHIQKFDKKSIWVGQHELPIGANYGAEIEKLSRLEQ